jgi:hypothetical protein
MLLGHAPTCFLVAQGVEQDEFEQEEGESRTTRLVGLQNDEGDVIVSSCPIPISLEGGAGRRGVADLRFSWSMGA